MLRDREKNRDTPRNKKVKEERVLFLWSDVMV